MKIQLNTHASIILCERNPKHTYESDKSPAFPAFMQ